ncbi:TetR family transcriptional regulator [Comamonas sp. Tr-654]|uniref:TetR family transcriptional regulator n=1 Tax=Comamonas sp. Tr-654 TaxID=2608341 RepID=UPI00141FD6C7|nr:TetR family transcriptional regulator [Comamonas sp. Tr-654]NIF85779.1 TetR family transcriptional regulator [Comamonas sp. Tr-654]
MAKSLPARSKVAGIVNDAPRKRDRERTLQELSLALVRVQQSGKKVTLKAVADEAKVSPPLIHNRYPDFAEQVRAVMGKAVRRQRDEMADLLIKEREKNRKLRELVSSQLVEIFRLASVNEALRIEQSLEKAIGEGKIVRGTFKK